MLRIGASQAGTAVFLSQVLFHILMLNTYGEGCSLVSAGDSAEARSVYKSGRGLGSLSCLAWLSQASGGGAGSLLGVRFWLGVALGSQGKALKVLSPEDMFPLSLRLS